MKDILNRSGLHWFNRLEIFLWHKNPKRFCRFCGNLPGYIQNPVWNNLLNQTGRRCPALRFAWPGSRGRAQGRLLWLCHLLSCLSTAQPPGRYSSPLLAPGTHSLPLTTGTIPLLSQATPPAGWQGEPLTLSRGRVRLAASPGQHWGMHYGGKPHPENVSKSAPTCPPFVCLFVCLVCFWFFFHSAGKMRLEKTTSEQKTNRVKQQHGYKTLISLLAQVLWYYLIYCQSTSVKITWETVSQALKLILARCLQGVGRVELPLSSFHPLSCQYWGPMKPQGNREFSSVPPRAMQLCWHCQALQCWLSLYLQWNLGLKKISLLSVLVNNMWRQRLLQHNMC